MTALAAAATPALLARAAENRALGVFQTLPQQVGVTLEAVAARILPTTDTPGAREAGAIWFIDALAAGVLGPLLPSLIDGAAALDSASGGAFVELAPDDQDAQLRAIEDGEFFGAMRLLTLAGTFTMSRYGGNRGEVGWDILGYQRRHSWQVPFGYYDAKVHGAGADAE